ncbi:ROK family protein [Candidatus Poribacteria bacterium]|nr:ROK family protein [Candidatus Poribacteria bacterium]MBT5714250.1 ROK family protein [Candidatus Poribacteria bacterium]MBT7100732.1 ROK family protein [Candidatus Poribacteria bacterium]
MTAAEYRPGQLVVAASVGGTKVACAAVDSAGTVIAAREPSRAPRSDDALHDLLVTEIEAVAAAVGRDRVWGVGVSFPECVAPPAAFAANGPPPPETPHPIVARVQRDVRDRLGSDTAVAVLHDAAAAVLGEVGAGGTLPGASDATFIVWGTGVASGVVRDGSLYWTDDIVQTMVAEVGALIVRQSDGTYRHDASPDWPRLTAPEQTLDRRMSGPWLAQRAQELGLVDNAESSVDDPPLARVNAAARAGEDAARRFIADAGHEFGSALSTFIAYWRCERGEAFADRIVIGSGVARIGDGLTGRRDALLTEELRRGVTGGLAAFGIAAYDADGVVVSALGHEREFLAFTPPW